MMAVYDCTVDSLHWPHHPIENPSFETLYIKDWIDRKGCSPVFCNEEKNEVAILHTEKMVVVENSHPIL